MSDRKAKVLLIPDLPIDRWHSMDRYADRLLRHLKRLEPAFADFQTAIPLSTITAEGGSAEGRNGARAGSVSPAARLWRRYRTYPRKVSRMRADLFHLIDHSYGHVAPALRGPVVATVHDLQPLMVLAEGTGSLRALVRNRFLRRSMEGLKAATAVIVSTSWMAGRVAEWIGNRIPVHVVPYGIDLDFSNARTDDERAGIREGYGIPSDTEMLLHVGSTERRKCLPRLMETVALLRDRNREVRLVQMGGDAAAIRDLATGHGVADLVIAAGSVTERQLRDGYCVADAFVFPSTYEGFGLPILEAMACGLPVVYSGAAATREVAGEAALLVEGNEAEAYAAAIAAVLDDGDARRRMADAGRERASQFTWERCARETIAVYREVLERQP